MSTTAMAFDVESPSPCERLDAFVVEIGELIGQRNAIDGRLVEIVAEIDRDGLNGLTGARSVASLGCSPRHIWAGRLPKCSSRTMRAGIHRWPKLV